jgi:hypothetical protein
VTKYIILLACTLLVIPVLYFIPLGLSTKNKLFLTVLAFVLAFSGLFTLNLLSYWTSAGTMVCLAFIAAYIVEKRLPIMQAGAKEIKTREVYVKSEPIYEKAIRAEQAASVVEAVIEPEILEEISLHSLEEVEFPQIVVEAEEKNEEDLFLIKDAVDLEELLHTEEEFAFLEEEREILSDYKAPALVAVELVEEPFVDRSMLFDEIEEMKN